MTIRVLIVDDSSFICKSIQGILEEDLDFKVVGVASNGKDAVALASQLEPDVITMDIEMPIMNGISAVKKIMATCPVAILMFSAATKVGAQATLDALNAGAIDFLPKQLNQIDGNKDLAKRLLRRRVRLVALQTKRIKSNMNDEASTTSSFKSSFDLKPVAKVSLPCTKKSTDIKIELLVIVASTGGPVAIQKILTQLPSNCFFPILIVQHMPHEFTKNFAERLNQLCSVTVKEATHGDKLVSGTALLGPGGMQIEVNAGRGSKTVSIREKQIGEIYSPCADITLTSVAKNYSANVLVVVLTGMGADGKEGAIQLKKKGLSIWAQDEMSSTIYGMPKAIVDANLADNVFSLDEIAHEFTKLS